MASPLKLLLEKCREPTTMENCDDFVQLQSLCETTNDFVKDFSKISFRGGHERYIDEIVRRLDTFLRQRKYVIKAEEAAEAVIRIVDVPACRKIFLFLLVNTKVPYDFDLDNDEQFCHCLNRIPQFSLCLFTNVVWGLHFDPFMYEFLAYAPSVMVLKWIDEVGTSARYGEPLEVIERCAKILDAVMTNLALAKNVSEAVCVQLVDATASILSNFNSPVKDVEEWATTEKHKFFGYMLMHLLQLSKRIIEIWKVGTEVTADVHLGSIYKFMVGETSVKTEAGKSGTVLGEFAVSILITLENTAMLVTTDMFIDWLDVEIPDPHGVIDTYSIQSKIGHCANEILEIVKPPYWHDVFTKLECIKVVRPPTTEIANEMTLSQLMCKLEPTTVQISAEDKKILLDEFISRGIIYSNEECLEVIATCDTQINSEQVHKILVTVAHEEVDDECQLILGNILSKVIDRLPTSELIDLIQWTPWKQVTFSKIDEYFFVNSFEPNKLVPAIFKDPNGFFACLSQIISNTQKFTKEVHMNSITNYVKAIEMVMQGEFRETFKLTLKNTLLQLFKLKLKESVSRGFPSFFQQLYACKLYTHEEFLKNFVVDIINGDDDDQVAFNYSARIATHCVDWRESVIDLDIVIRYGKILDDLRLDLIKYGNNANEMIEVLIDAIKTMLGKKSFEAAETRKIYAELEDCCSPTMYYFLRYLDERLHFDEFLFPDSFTEEETIREISNYLSQLSVREMRELIKNRRHITDFTESMYLLMITNPNDKAQMMFKLQICFKNYLIVYQEITKITDLDHLKLLKRICAIIELFKDGMQEYATLAALPHIQKQLEMILSADETMLEEIEGAIRNLEEKEMIEGLIMDFFNSKDEEDEEDSEEMPENSQS